MPNVRSCTCDECPKCRQTLYMRVWRELHRDRLLERRRYLRRENPGHRLRERYGIDLVDYNAILVSQGGVCAICRDPNKKGGKTLPLAVDHCHSTGRIRGLLCHACNVSLGKFEDNVAYLQRAVEYLSRKR